MLLEISPIVAITAELIRRMKKTKMAWMQRSALHKAPCKEQDFQDEPPNVPTGFPAIAPAPCTSLGLKFLNCAQSSLLRSRLHNDQYQTMTGVLAALGAAMAWTGASALWRSLSGRVTAIRLNAMKNGLASLLFLPVLLTLPYNTDEHAVLLLTSGLIGIAAGDSFYFCLLYTSDAADES